jgi:hypothetical protein
VAFLEQLLESIRRVEYVRVIRDRSLSFERADPASALFDPIKAAVLRQREGDVEEAIWLVFLFVHFGKHRRDGWRLLRDVYRGLGQTFWGWPTISSSSGPHAFRKWLARNAVILKGVDGIRRRFGNHRKYESLDAWGSHGTGAAVESYVGWIGSIGSQAGMFSRAIAAMNGDRQKAFDYLYRTMKVTRFGRTARFDYLTMIGKLHLAEIEPGRPYFQGATGPVSGARLLYGARGASGSSVKLEKLVIGLDAYLRVGMQVLEDALCNWQKSPARFRPFRG